MSDTPVHDSAPAPLAAREDALAVVRRLRGAGHVAYFAGGCVRDMLLGLEPTDFDIATDAAPDRVRQLFSQTQAVGAAFGVILVRHRNSQVEVATFRSDMRYTDGRRPEGVVFTTAEEDAKRRDFTINGMFFDPLDESVIDYVGGQEDLKGKVLRAIGEPHQRFEEDHLRLLRAVRFAARFGLSIDPTTASAISGHADQLKRISPERVADELRLMLTPPTRNVAWEMLWRFGLLQVLMRQLPERADWPPFTDRGTRALFPLVAAEESISFGLALAALTLCYRRNSRELPAEETLLAAPEIQRAVKAMRATLKISNEEADMMDGAMDVAHLLLPDPPGVAQLKRFLAKPFAEDAGRLLKALGDASYLLAPRVQWIREQCARLEHLGNVAPPPFVTGDDLTAAGLSPGPVFKRVLDAVYDAQLEDRVTSKDHALELALRLARG